MSHYQRESLHFNHENTHQHLHHHHHRFLHHDHVGDLPVLAVPVVDESVGGDAIFQSTIEHHDFPSAFGARESCAGVAHRAFGSIDPLLVSQSHVLSSELRGDTARSHQQQQHRSHHHRQHQHLQHQEREHLSQKPEAKSKAGPGAAPSSQSDLLNVPAAADPVEKHRSVSVDGSYLTNARGGQFSAKCVENPPDLEEWRQKLFDLGDTVYLDEEEFNTYFPWVDNVYSHRSTQHYKRKPVVTHYWDCRMKGRASGTPKSSDPNKKKRKRQVRERDLCDVKIKITEYKAGAASYILEPQSTDHSVAEVDPTLAAAVTRFQDHLFFSIQRVNGNGTNGIGDGKPSTHKHDLAKSDEIKKCSVQRMLASREKDAKKGQKPSQWKPTGSAAATARMHAQESGIKLYAACFCPFSQRVWIALEAKGLQYQYCETDPFRRPTHLLEANPRGLVPAISEGSFGLGESAVILEYLEEIDSTVLLLPTEYRLRANCRLWIDFINTKIVPSFYSLLAAKDKKSESEGIKGLQRDILRLVQNAEAGGPYFLGDQMSLVDINFAPFALRLSRLLQPYRNWTPPTDESRWKQWIEALENNPHIRSTTSADSLYISTAELLIRSFAHPVIDDTSGP
ncbi:hypothetical protein B0H63DRAFT_555753 [Podospora didyma]|uniref:Glutathione S-transferase n=1 Tax=Podospora didyma TaxID=330526 RepID=A0AAE0P704_9PEZI|nr:hypothetical protein B0H63DRAFT_555753 [Podospora didyma]